MRRDVLAFALSGVFFGFLVGWIIGSERATSAPAPAAAPEAAAAPAPAAPPASGPPPPLDTAREADLERQAKAEPTNAAVRTQIGDLYFDAEKYDQAIPWYEAAEKLDPKDPNLSTDLGVSYYYTNQVDRALAQFDHSLALDPKHLKTLLDRGIVLAFGKHDMAAAADSWQKVVAIAPNSEEGQAAQQGLDGMKAASQGSGAAPRGGA